RALTAEVRRLLTVRSTGIFAALLIGCCVGPIVLMGIVYDPAYRGPIDAGDLGKCVSIFHVLAIVFAGTHTATEINAGSTALAFLTRSGAVSVAAPITWMLLIEQLASMVPMLEAITPWLPFNASHMLLAQALGEAPAGMSVWPPAVALLVPALGLAGAGLCAHV